jgi:ketosteroid isomerase-like protein
VSGHNVELHRRLNAAFVALDLATLLELCHPQIEFRTRFAPLGGVPVYRGPDGMRTFMREMEDVWGDTVRIEAEHYFDLGENTLAFYVLGGRAQHSQTDVTMQATVVATWRDGLCIQWKSYVDRNDALLELGVSEHELQRLES